MKRSNTLRRTAIKRTRMRPGNRKSKYSRRVRDVQFMMFVKSLPCLLAGNPEAGPCSGVTEADHAGLRGMGQKAPDNTCVSLCSRHHRDRHGCMGFFRGRERLWKREWRANAIAFTQARYAEHACP